MKNSMNQTPGIYYIMESRWSKVLERNGTVKNIEWTISYGSDGRPTQIDVVAKVNGAIEEYNHLN